MSNVKICEIYQFLSFCLQPTEELRGSFRFKSYILIAKIYKVSVLVSFFYFRFSNSLSCFNNVVVKKRTRKQYNLSLKMKFFSRYLFSHYLLDFPSVSKKSYTLNMCYKMYCSLALGHSYYLCTRSLLHLKR